MEKPKSQVRAHKGAGWWPLIVIVLVTAAAICWVRSRAEASFQERNLQTLAITLGGMAVTALWWLTGGPLKWKTRFLIAFCFVAVIGLGAALFRIRGVSGDLRPIWEFRWAGQMAQEDPTGTRSVTIVNNFRQDFPQFLGPARNAVLEGPSLDPDWRIHPPAVLWRKPIGAAWSGWAIVGNHALTQEQRPDGECTSCYDLITGGLLWSVAEAAHYQTAIAGEGPRCTPSIAGQRVLSVGATGKLNCLDLDTGRRVWSRDIVADAHSRVPEWGVAGSPLVVDDKVVVIGGGDSGRSLLAYSLASGELVWSGGDQPMNYSSPVLLTINGTRQIIAFNHPKITAHDPSTGRVLWDYPWGNGQPQVAVPLLVGSNRLVFSSGYGVGAELLEVSCASSGHWAASRVWQSRKMKAKFATLVQQDGFLYGLDDGVLACLDLANGSQRWKEGRYGHGQGLLIGDLYLLMSENGEVVLLRPTPQGPGELGRFKLFTAKTWNPIAVSGELLLARNDQEAACVRLPLAGKPK